MFSNDLILGREFAQEFIPHVHLAGDVDANGFSLSLIARALFYKRASEEMPITFNVQPLGKEVHPATDFTDPKNFCVDILQATDNPADDKVQELLAEWDSVLYPRYKINETVDVFAKRLRTDSEVQLFRYYVDEENHRAVAVVASRDRNIAWIVQATLHHLVPWMFKDQERTTDEIAFAKAIFSTGGDATTDAYIQKIEEELRLRKSWQLSNMRNWAKTANNRRYEEAKRRVESIKNNVDELSRRFSRALVDLHNAQEAETGARQAALAKQGKEDELVALFDSTDALELVNANEEVMTFRVYTDLGSWDEEAYRNIVEEEDSYIWWDDDHEEDRCDDEDRDVWRKVLDDIFLRDKLKIRVKAEFKLNVVEGTVSGSGVSDDNRNWINNPHIGGYSCMGQNTTKVQEAVLAGNLVYAVEQCMHSAANFNFDDSTVGESFFRTLFSNNNHHFLYDVETGELMNPATAFKSRA